MIMMSLRIHFYNSICYRLLPRNTGGTGIVIYFVPDCDKCVFWETGAHTLNQMSVRDFALGDLD